MISTLVISHQRGRRVASDKNAANFGIYKKNTELWTAWIYVWSCTIKMAVTAPHRMTFVSVSQTQTTHSLHCSVIFRFRSFYNKYFPIYI